MEKRVKKKGYYRIPDDLRGKRQKKLGEDPIKLKTVKIPERLEKGWNPDLVRALLELVISKGFGYVKTLLDKENKKAHG